MQSAGFIAYLRIKIRFFKCRAISLLFVIAFLSVSNTVLIFIFSKKIPVGRARKKDAEVSTSFFSVQF